MLYKPQSTVIRAHTNISEGTSNLCIKSTKSEIDKTKKETQDRVLWFGDLDSCVTSLRTVYQQKQCWTLNDYSAVQALGNNCISKCGS